MLQNENIHKNNGNGNNNKEFLSFILEMWKILLSHNHSKGNNLFAWRVYVSLILLDINENTWKKMRDNYEMPRRVPVFKNREIVNDRWKDKKER